MVLACWLLAGLNGCVLGPPQPSAPPPAMGPAVAACQQLYSDLDHAARSDLGPSSPRSIAGFPYLRVDRFSASFRDQPLDAAAQAAWLEHMLAADLRARTIIMTAAERDRLERCARRLLAADLADPQRLQLLRARAVVPSEYRTLQQLLGLYPLSAMAVGIGIRGYQRDTLATFATPLVELLRRGELRRYRLASGASAGQSSTLSGSDLTRDALGVPRPTSNQLKILFAAHAPVWEIDVAGRYDLPGRPVWRRTGTGALVPGVDSGEALVYVYPSYVRWQGQPLLQLNYIIWFDARPASGRFDILSGALDGVHWRVTLRPSLDVLVYDTIHPCGCYHFFFPSEALALRSQARHLPEPPLLPQGLLIPARPEDSSRSEIVIRLASASHYVQRVSVAPRPAGGHATGKAHEAYEAYYQLRDYDELYATPVIGFGFGSDAIAGGQASLFAPGSGLVDGSERAERWLLWPMGIPSPGAMRERGRHAVAFVGRRHFDDADLLERLFQPTNQKDPSYEP